MLSRIGVRTSNSSANAAFLEIIAGSKIRGFWLRSIEVINGTAAAQTFGLGEPAAIGVGPTSPVPLIPVDTSLPAPTTEGTGTSNSHVTTALAWGTTAPTVPASYLCRATFPATAGTRVSWDFSNDPIFVPSGSTLVLWGTGTNAANDVNIVVDEVPA